MATLMTILVVLCCAGALKELMARAMMTPVAAKKRGSSLEMDAAAAVVSSRRRGLERRPASEFQRRNRTMDVMRALRMAAVLAGCWAAGCSGEGENSFKSNRPEFDEALRKELAAANISFREDARGFVLYSSRHEAAVREIMVRIDKELSSGIAWQVDDEGAREYLKGVLASIGMKYSIQPRADGTWVQWNPASEEQKLDVQLKLVQYMFQNKVRTEAARTGDRGEPERKNQRCSRR